MTKNKIENYLQKTDWRVNENANSGSTTFSGLMAYLANTEIATDALENMYTKEIADAHKNGDMHIHDLGFAMIPYCHGWSLGTLIKEGINKIPGKASSGPAKHLNSLMIQMVNFLGCTQMEAAGAQAFNNCDTHLAPFVKKDDLSFEQVKQYMQQLVFNLNIPSRWGSQAPFTNFTFDIMCPEDMKDRKAIVAGIEQDFTYGDCQNEMDLVNLAFMEIMEEGDSDGQPFTFPIPTYNIDKSFDWDCPVTDKLMEMASKYGTPYFANYVGSGMKASDIRSMCCRLRLEIAEIRKKHGGLFGSGDNTGSLGVATINLPRIGYLSKNISELYSNLNKILLLAKESLDIKRKYCNKSLEDGILPYTKRYLDFGFDNHFSTIGIVGMNELLRNFIGCDIGSKEGIDLAINIMDFLNIRLSTFQEDSPDKVLYNLEATPAEGTSYRLAKIDKEKYPDIITANDTETTYYTNSVHLPVGFTDDLFEVLELQDELQTKFSSGTVIHAYAGQRIENPNVLKELVKKIVCNFKLPYFSFTPTFSTCPDHGYLAGEVLNCPICNKETLVWSRVVGYIRNVSAFNKGKKQEFKDREFYKVEEDK